MKGDILIPQLKLKATIKKLRNKHDLSKKEMTDLLYGEIKFLEKEDKE